MKTQGLKHPGDALLLCFSRLFRRGPAIQELPQQRDGNISCQNKHVINCTLISFPLAAITILVIIISITISHFIHLTYEYAQIYSITKILLHLY